MEPAPAALSLEERWRSIWPEALSVWSPYTQLREPLFFHDDEAAKPYGMARELASIRLSDQRVLINLHQIQAKGLDELALPILAHEIGHHVYVPGNVSDHARVIAA